MKKLAIAAVLVALPLAAVAVHAVHAQMPDMMKAQMQTGGHGPMAHPSTQEMPNGMQGRMQDHMQRGSHASHAPTMPGQDAFGTIQEIVQILEADPKTDWSKVDLEGLRQHLIDMNDVTLKSDVKTTPIEGGIEATVTGTGRTVEAIQRMVIAHATELSKMNGWTAKADKISSGVRLTVTSTVPAQVDRLRGLGFIGLVVSGAHHQIHHLAMAKGEFTHAHN
jgi:hypothetical protein